MAKLNRRNFLASFASGIMGFGLVNYSQAKLNKVGFPQTESTPLKIKKYNLFGKTGLKVSDVSCGAISLFEPNVIRYAYDLGVNYFDTAESYLRTKSESYIGQALKDVRDKVIIATKHHYYSPSRISKENIIHRMEASLKRLQTDYVDVALVHNISDLSLLKNEELLEAYSQLRKQGKIRFTGFSTHNGKVTLKQALDNEFSQVILTIYNHYEGKDIEPLLEKAHSKGIATIAMKVFAGGKHGKLKSTISKDVSYPQAAIRWVLSNVNIDCCIVTMSSYSHVEEYIRASGKTLNRADLKVISEYRRQTHDKYCRVSCHECLSSCPHGIAINDILRYKMYFEDYGIEKEAMRYYSELNRQKKPIYCSDCKGNCISACPYGLKVKDELIHAHKILTA